jgi:hypothetical protein
MNSTLITLFVAASLAFSSTAFAGPSKTYQVTGPVLEMNDDMIAVQKGKERWELARNASTKANAEIKVGSKVTITYTMTATQVEAKADNSTQADGPSSPKPAATPKK